MSIRFEKRKKAGPFRFSLTKSGVGFSFGLFGNRIARQSDGRIRLTLKIPFTNFRTVKYLGKKRGN